ncbi:MAG: FAD-dependent oxidoreductase [Spirochaetales bacterium]|nr:FAD-dependent oxidoreductase [Spirochaetales bacterium]
MSESSARKILVVGGVAAGATAAARIRRLDESAEITIVEKGRYVSFANCGLPYFVSRDIQKRSQLILQTPEGFFARYRVDVLLETEAVGIDRAGKLLKVRDASGERELPYDALILAQGGTPFVPPVEGKDAPHVFRLWTIPDMDAVHKYIDAEKPESAVVVGGGFIGLEAAEAFVKRGLKTTIVELTPRVMPPADPEFGSMIAASFEEAGATVITGRSVNKVDAASKTVILDDGTVVDAGIVLMSAGVRPNTELAKAAGLEIGASGGVAVDETLRTADPAIWAAGDMIEVTQRVAGRKVRVPLAGPANRQGRIAATNMLGGKAVYRGALGTSVFKAVEDTFAMTGLTEKAARDAGFPVGVASVVKGNHVSYYPGSTDVVLKLVFDRATRKVLGAQAFGRDGIEKRVDVVATALLGGLTVDDLSELDLSYAPPYGSANDPLNMAAFAAMNELSGFSPLALPREALEAVAKGEGAIVDVRGYGEWARGHAAGSIHLPLDELRDRHEELPKDRTLYLVSKGGYESHVALRQLVQNGFDKVRNVTGGWTFLSREDGLVLGED